MRCDECLQKINPKKIYIVKYKDGTKTLTVPCQKCKAANIMPLSLFEIRSQI